MIFNRTLCELVVLLSRLLLRKIYPAFCLRNPYITACSSLFYSFAFLKVLFKIFALKEQSTEQLG
jgi:hypothetical protein